MIPKRVNTPVVDDTPVLDKTPQMIIIMFKVGTYPVQVLISCKPINKQGGSENEGKTALR
jgi:hypothetical protein